MAVVDPVHRYYGRAEGNFTGKHDMLTAIAGLAATACFFNNKALQMSTTEKYLTWSPRIIASAFVGVLAFFSLDAFNGEGSLGEKAGGFLIHLLPAFITVGCLAVAWKYRLWGGVLFLFLGIVFTFYFGTAKNIYNFLLISAPLFAAGALFLLSAAQQKAEA